MPLLHFDVLEGRNSEQIKDLLDATHRAVLKAFKVPLRDRFQVVNEHAASNFVVEDAGLSIPRTKNIVVLRVTTRPRTEEEKKHFYKELCRELKTNCDIDSSDVMVSIVTNSDEDWSFGYGEAQFLNGKL